MKTHLNSKNQISMELKDVDNIFNIKARSEDAKDIDVLVMTSLNSWTKSYVTENDQFKEIGSDTVIKQDEYSLLCDYKHGEYIIQVLQSQILLLSPDLKSELFKYEFSDLVETKIENICVSPSKSQILLIVATNQLMV